MSNLRRRILEGKDASDSSRDQSPARAEEVRLAPVSKILTGPPGKQKHRKRRNGFIFFLGGLFGIVAAGFFANQSDLIDFPELGELSMSNLLDVLPAGMVKDARDLAVSDYPKNCLCILKANGYSNSEGSEKPRIMIPSPSV